MDKGAHFHRCDFQVHTPRDLGWKGNNCVTVEERQAYAESLVQACRQKELHAIAVSDHHDMVFIPYIRKAAQAETDEDGKALPPERRLIVFPAMELTLGVPCQALLLLDADFPDNMFSAVMTALTIPPPDETNPKSAPTVKRLDPFVSFKVLKEKLDEHDWLRDRYIILPNVTGEGEHSLLRAGQTGKYSEMPCVGGYIDGALSKLKPGRRRILDGKDKAWGNKRIASFQTSDNRRADHADLGKHTSWVKWAVPTAEALRQACLAQESRISQEGPKLPAVVITRISVSNSKFLGPVDLSFNAQYNALIGGRGTGKSTILEYLRWALCDQPPAGGDDDTPDYQSRRASLIENTLKPHAASVDVSFIINGVPYLIRRNSEDGSLQIKIGSDELRSCSADEVRTLLPVQAYSQKQLSNVSVRIEELQRFITAPIRSNLIQIDQQISDKADRIRETYATLRRQKALIALLAKRELEARSLKEQADALRKALTGLSDDDRALLDQGSTYDAAEHVYGAWQTDVHSLLHTAQKLSMDATANRERATLPPDMPHAEILESAVKDYRAVMSETKAALDAVITRASLVLTPTADESPWSLWPKKLAEFRKAYGDALLRSSAHSEKLEQLQNIEAQLANHQKETARIGEELKELKDGDTAYQEEQAAWYSALSERDTLLDDEGARLTKNSNEAIRAYVRRHTDTSAFITRLREALSGSGLRGNRFDDFSAAITESDNPQQIWTSLLDDLEHLATFDPEESGVEQRPDTPHLAAIGMSPRDLDRIAYKLSPESWLDLSLINVKGVPVFEYRSREGEYIPFSNASAGQQATALLKTLLNQPGPPLLIDQPEEDLDNPVMPEIIEQLWQAKQKRQIIFVSHNANLVVNGDAELVAWCDYRTAGDQSGGRIAGQGAIDIADVRDAIKHIMEGGDAAFKLRREKYGF